MMPQRHELKGILLGTGLVLFMHLIATIIAYLLAVNFIDYSQQIMLTLFSLGLTQLIYVLPAIAVTARKRKFALMKGVIIAAVITALLNGGCWLIVYYAVSQAY